MSFKLDNTQRKYLGLNPISSNWDIVEFKGGTYRPNSYLVFEKDILKKHIVSTNNEYHEYQYDDLTRNREFLLPKTKRGKEKKLTPSVLENRQPKGVYFSFSPIQVIIGSYATQTTFYSTRMERVKIKEISEFKKWLSTYISESDEDYLLQIDSFKKAKRKNVKAKEGDFFAFKIDRKNYGFGRVLSSIDKLRKVNELRKTHGLYSIMGKPMLIKIYYFKSQSIDIDLKKLVDVAFTPSQYIFDNHIFYGEYPIIGNIELSDNEIDFPISYGESSSIGSLNIFLQWGLIHNEKAKK